MKRAKFCGTGDGIIVGMRMLTVLVEGELWYQRCYKSGPSLWEGNGSPVGRMKVLVWMVVLRGRMRLLVGEGSFAIWDIVWRKGETIYMPHIILIKDYNYFMTCSSLCWWLTIELFLTFDAILHLDAMLYFLLFHLSIGTFVNKSWVVHFWLVLFCQSNADLLFGGITIVCGIFGTLAGGLILDKIQSTISNAFKVNA